MKKVLVIALVFALTFVLGYASPVPAQDQDQIKLSGPHYTLNIIGVEKGKTAAMTNSDRHTIFVGLGSKNSETLVTTNIYLKPGYDFKVCDGNGFDPAYDCDGNQIKQNLGATFQLPCNTALSYAEGFRCAEDIAKRTYHVYARALGKPGGKANMMTCATDVTDVDNPELVCATDNVLELPRSKGQSRWQDATNELTSLVINNGGVIETIALFATGFEDFFWQYDNYGLKHAQIRLYPASQ